MSDTSIENELRHVNTLTVDSKPVACRLLGHLFLRPVFFRVQAYALTIADLEKLVYPKEGGRRKVSPTLCEYFEKAIQESGHQVGCLKTYRPFLVDPFKGATDQDGMKVKLRTFIESDVGAPIRSILRIN